MSEEMEVFEGEEITEEERLAEQADFEPEEIELSEEELDQIAGGRRLVKSGQDRKAYCPWCGVYHNCSPCGRFTGKLGGKAKLTNMQVWWCNSRRKSFYGPSTKHYYWADDGIQIR